MTGDRTRRSPLGWRPPPSAVLLTATLLICGAAATRADDPQNCLLCHQYRGLARFDRDSGRLRLFFVRPDYTTLRLGPHARIACADCHDPQAVGVIPHAPVPPVNCTQTCHLIDPAGLARRFSHEGVARMLGGSTHSPEILAKTEFAGGPLLNAGQSACLYCHDEPVFRDPADLLARLPGWPERAFDRCDVCHAEQIPLDTAYQLRHVTARLRTARPPLELAQVCAVCHSDPLVCATTGQHDAVASFLRSFHGKAALLGNQEAADCVSCHVRAGTNAHLMLNRHNPESAVYPTRAADNCRMSGCHPGADAAIASASVHLDLTAFRGTPEYLLAAAFILLTIATFGPSMLIVVLELAGQVVGREHHGSQRLAAVAARLWADPRGRRLLIRFTVSQRVQHWILAILFTLLALTGFPMKFADRGWARSLVHTFGGLDTTRQIHHLAGFALVTGLVAHMLYALPVVLRHRRQTRAAGGRPSFIRSVAALPMWIGWDDARKFTQLLGYLVGRRRAPPTFGRFTVKEKFEYLGVFWGTMLLGATGAVLWGEQYATRFISGRVLNLALIAHTYEAFLAIIHVGILHIINVVLKPNVFPLSPATITGRTPLVELVEEHSEQVVQAATDLGMVPEGGLTHE